MSIDAGEELISAEMRGLVGKVHHRCASYPISASDIRKWAIAVYYPDPAPNAYLRGGAAAGGPLLVAPEEFNPFAWAIPDPSSAPKYTGPGHLEASAGVAPPPLNVIVNGGTACEYGVPMREGDVITSEVRIRSYVQKPGKRGPLLITETEDHWTNQQGETVRRTIQTLVRY